MGNCLNSSCFKKQNEAELYEVLTHLCENYMVNCYYCDYLFCNLCDEGSNMKFDFISNTCYECRYNYLIN